MYKFVIAGGGSASSTMVGHLLRTRRILPSEILVIEPSRTHNYQPGWTMVGGGLLGSESDIMKESLFLLQQNTENMFHPKVEILQKEIINFDPENNKVFVSGNESVTYENLIVALGIATDYEVIPGLVQAIEDPNSPVGSIYKFPYALKMNKIIQEFKGGNAIFNMAPQPIKCAGAPQKIMHLAYEAFQKNGVGKVKVDYYMPQPVIFGVPKYANILKNIAASKGIGVFPEHQLARLEPEKRIAYFKNKGSEIAVQYDLLHVTPPQRPVDVLKKSKIVDAAGFVDVDKYTLQHKKYPNIWSLGDCSSLPNSKTMAATMSQSLILVNNLFKMIDGKPLNAKYYGYSSCPIFVGNNKLLLCEFKYDGVLDESFPNLQNSPSRLLFLAKKYFFPRVYLHLIKRGWWFGRNLIFRPNFF